MEESFHEMTDRVRFLTHPEVVQDPNVPVPEWGLSEPGFARMRGASTKPWVQTLTAVWSSTERKALDGADVLAASARVERRTLAILGEIDRSSTGYLPVAEHDANTDRFFADPQTSARGWERAIDAQQRILSAIDDIVAESPAGDIAVVAHGAVGTLLLCSLRDVPIRKVEDQPFPGHGFAFVRDSRRLIHGWVPLEDVE